MGTYHPELLPPKTKSILVQCEVSFGLVNPVNVAKFDDRLRRGLIPRRSINLKSGSWLSSTANFAAKVAFIATGLAAPVAIL